MSRISLVSWEALSEEEREDLRERRNESIHMVEGGANVKKDEARLDLVFAVVEKTSGRHIGIVRWSPPLYRADAAWWIDSEFRECGYGKEAVTLLAKLMREKGVTGACVGIDAVSEEHRRASRMLKTLFESLFLDGCPS
jgi:hypothetical protein